MGTSGIFSATSNDIELNTAVHGGGGIYIQAAASVQIGNSIPFFYITPPFLVDNLYVN